MVYICKEFILKEGDKFIEKLIKNGRKKISVSDLMDIVWRLF